MAGAWHPCVNIRAQITFFLSAIEAEHELPLSGSADTIQTTHGRTPSTPRFLITEKEKGKVHPIYRPLVCIHILSVFLLSPSLACIAALTLPALSTLPSLSPLPHHPLFRPKLASSLVRSHLLTHPRTPFPDRFPPFC